MIQRRPITDADLPFLQRLYASTREEELAQVPWSEAQKQAFLAMQFQAQHQHYQEHFKNDRFDVLLASGEPIGRLYVGDWPSEIRIIDIALTPESRGKGLGGRLIKDLCAKAAGAKKVVRIHVEKQNRAMTLYRRLGFRTIEDKGVYDLMEWSAPL